MDKSIGPHLSTIAFRCLSDLLPQVCLTSRIYILRLQTFVIQNGPRTEEQGEDDVKRHNEATAKVHRADYITGVFTTSTDINTSMKAMPQEL